MSNLPKIQDLYSDKVAVAKNDAFITLMNQPPNPAWVKKHPYIKKEVTQKDGTKIKVPYEYLPIERVEYLLKTIFKRYRIEITGQGQSFNGVWVTVRVHYVHPLTGEWDFHDGIGASQLQTAKGTSPADLNNINNGAISMAFPMAKTLALKDACDNFGKLFGSDLSRPDIIYTPDLTLIPMDKQHPNWSKVVEAVKNGNATLEQVKTKYNLTPEAEDELTNL